jgi:hypothetical protein
MLYSDKTVTSSIKSDDAYVQCQFSVAFKNAFAAGRSVTFYTCGDFDRLESLEFFGSDRAKI